jgi:hypothetical protein
VRDGSRVFITTASRLTSDDVDGAEDLYAIDLANQPPDCGAVSARPAVLWPANRKLVRVKLRGAGDPDGDAVALRIDGITQDEPTGKGDAVRVRKPHKVLLRAERSRKGDGRVYRITFTATDDRGATCTGIVKVSVPRHRRRAAVDSAPPSYDSFRR